MLSCSGNGCFALGLISGFCLTLLLSLAIPLGHEWWLNIPAPESERYAREQCARQQQGEPLLPPTPFGQEQPRPSAIGEDGQRTEDAQHIDWCALAAQENIANSTGGLNRAAWATTGLTLFALIALVFTLLATREAAREAKRAADAGWGAVDQAKISTKISHSAVAVSREMGVIQTRAYLNYTMIRIDNFERGRVPIVSAVLKNTGATPARKVFPFYAINWTSHPDTVKLGDPFTNRSGVGAVVAPGAEVSIEREFNVDDSFWEFFSRKEVVPIFLGVCIYRDVFGKTRRSICRAYLPPENIRNGSGPFRMSLRQNRSS
jgi:hypothetical protein